jgi:hypothetical protein
MHNTCVKAVAKARTSLEKIVALYTYSTAAYEYLTSQVFFMHAPRTCFGQLLGLKPQAKGMFDNPLTGFLYTLSPTTMNATKLIKE